ncbi:MAG: RNA polymerase sigma factor [Bacteroidota bacterium]
MTEPFARFPQNSRQLRSFLNENLDRLTHHAWAITGNRTDADDVVQEAVIRAYHIRAKLGEVTNPVAYLFTMVSNGCIDMLRRRNSRENTISANGRLTMNHFSEPREEEMIREEEAQRVRSMLNLLPGEQAEVIRLRFDHDLTFRDIAAIKELPVTTVKSRFSYGMSKLSVMMKEKTEVSDEM